MIYPEVHFPMEASLRWSGAVFTNVKHRVALIWHTVSPLCLTTNVARHLSLCCRWGWQLEPLQGWSSLHKLEGLHQMHRATKTRCPRPRAPGKVFVATKAPKLTRLSHTPQLEAPNKSREPPRLREINNRLGYQRALEEQALGHQSTQE